MTRTESRSTAFNVFIFLSSFVGWRVPEENQRDQEKVLVSKLEDQDCCDFSACHYCSSDLAVRLPWIHLQIAFMV